jgi:hypothetical protein
MVQTARNVPCSLGTVALNGPQPLPPGDTHADIARLKAERLTHEPVLTQSRRTSMTAYKIARKGRWRDASRVPEPWHDKLLTKLIPAEHCVGSIQDKEDMGITPEETTLVCLACYGREALQDGNKSTVYLPAKPGQAGFGGRRQPPYRRPLRWLR